MLIGMKKIKRWFTLVEMLIVIMIMGILFVAFKSSFQIKNKDTLYGQVCMERIYENIHEFLTAWLQSKAINRNEKRIFPDRYILQFDVAEQVINLATVEWSDIVPYQAISLRNTNDEYCENQRYYIQMTGDSYRVHINKGLQENNNNQIFYISDIDSLYQGENTFVQCDKGGWICTEIARIQTDTRIMGIDKYVCLSNSTAGQCEERDQ